MDKFLYIFTFNDKSMCFESISAVKCVGFYDDNHDIYEARDEEGNSIPIKVKHCEWVTGSSNHKKQIISADPSKENALRILIKWYERRCLDILSMADDYCTAIDNTLKLLEGESDG